jgi:hypothetical protein
VTVLLNPFEDLRNYTAFEVGGITHVDDDRTWINLFKHQIKQLLAIKRVNIRGQQSLIFTVCSFLCLLLDNDFVLKPQVATAHAKSRIVRVPPRLVKLLHFLDVPEGALVLLVQLIKANQGVKVGDLVGGVLNFFDGFFASLLIALDAHDFIENRLRGTGLLQVFVEQALLIVESGFIFCDKVSEVVAIL